MLELENIAIDTKKIIYYEDRHKRITFECPVGHKIVNQFFCLMNTNLLCMQCVCRLFGSYS